MEDEIKNLQTNLILCLGNCTLYGLTGKKGGITKLSGQIEWSDKYQAWICYCMHPSSIFRSSDNKKLFKKGIRTFARALKKTI